MKAISATRQKYDCPALKGALMKTLEKACIYLQAVIIIFCQFALCAEGVKFKDGTYEGTVSFVKVNVTVKDNKITGIEIIEHGGGGKEYTDEVKPLVDDILTKQSTDVDAITGATASSENLKKAVRDALEKASAGGH